MFPQAFFRLLALLSLLTCWDFSVAAEPKVITYPGPESESGVDPRNNYFVELLKLALAQSGKTYDAQEAQRGLSSIRQLQMVAGGAIDVTWNLSSSERNVHLTSIQIPIDKGLIGWRLLLINKKDQPFFSRISTLDQLKPITAGQVQAWQDTDILRANGLTVEGTPGYHNTFKMLMARRILYFPRSIMEIWPEAEANVKNGLAIENSLLIQYPVTYFYFVNKNNPELAKDIENGLLKIMANGAFDEIFYRYHGQFISQANIQHRRVFRLTNPFFAANSKFSHSSYWFDPSQLSLRPASSAAH